MPESNTIWNFGRGIVMTANRIKTTKKMDKFAKAGLEASQILQYYLDFIPWIGSLLCEAVEQHPRAALYAALARFTRAFVEVETQGFDMIE